LQFGIDTWYDTPLQNFTFKTVMIPLSFEDAQAIVQKSGNESDQLENVQTTHNIV
jgi:hypothetical protein